MNYGPAKPNGADALDRKCVTCGDWFTPWSMAPDGEPQVLAPTEYECLSCRSKAGV